jgi:hypothetical protein
MPEKKIPRKRQMHLFVIPKSDEDICELAMLIREIDRRRARIWAERNQWPTRSAYGEIIRLFLDQYEADHPKLLEEKQK